MRLNRVPHFHGRLLGGGGGARNGAKVFVFNVAGARKSESIRRAFRRGMPDVINKMRDILRQAESVDILLHFALLPNCPRLFFSVSN